MKGDASDVRYSFNRVGPQVFLVRWDGDQRRTLHVLNADDWDVKPFTSRPWHCVEFGLDLCLMLFLDVFSGWGPETERMQLAQLWAPEFHEQFVMFCALESPCWTGEEIACWISDELLRGLLAQEQPQTPLLLKPSDN